MSEDMLNLLNYLYNDFAVTFVICLCGAIIKDTMDTYKNINKINIKRVIFSTIFVTILLCAIRVLIDVKFNIYIFICVVAGMWGYIVLDAFSNAKFMLIFLKKIAKGSNSTLGNTISDVLEETEKEEKE